jgi:hypothetical protein
LLPGTGSSAGLDTVAQAMLLSVPVAFPSSVPMTVNIVLPPTSRSTDSLRSPDPFAAHEEPADAMQVHVMAVSSAGKVSMTEAPVTSFGPLFVTVIR